MFLTIVQDTIKNSSVFEDSLASLGFKSNHSPNTKVIGPGDFEGYPPFERITFSKDKLESLHSKKKLYTFLEDFFINNDVVIDYKSLNDILSVFTKDDPDSLIKGSRVLSEFLYRLYSVRKDHSIVLYAPKPSHSSKLYSHLIFKNESVYTVQKDLTCLMVYFKPYKKVV